MKSEWPEFQVSDLEYQGKLLVQDGNHGEYRPRKSEFCDDGIAFIRAADFSGSTVNFRDAEKINTTAFNRIRKGIGRDLDTILSTKGTVGKIAFVPKGSPEFVCSPQTSFWRSLDEAFLLPEFLYYEMQSSFFVNQILSRQGETDMAAYLSLTSQRGMYIRVPNISTQKQVVKLLSCVDKKITINGESNQTLEQMAQAIFKSWFVDFEPVKAKIAALIAGGSEEDALLAAMQAISGKDRAELIRLQAEQPEQYNGLRATAKLFPSTMQDSELGDIPQGWSISQIGNELTVVGGGTPSTKNHDFWERGEIHWTTPKDLSSLNNKVLIDTERKITAAGLAKISSGLLPIDTVLMSSRAPVGYLALAKTPVAINQGYIAMKCDKILSPEFVLQWCESMMDEIKGRASGTTFAEISKKSFKVIPVTVPPAELIKAYTKLTKSIYESIEISVRKSGSLANLRDTLLPQLLSGSGSIDDMEA